MEYLIPAVGLIFGIAVFLLIVNGVQKRKRQKQLDKEYEESQKNLLGAHMARPVWTKREATNYPRRGIAPSQPVTQPSSSGMDPLMAGVIGYAIGHSGSAHASPVERRDDTPAFSGLGGDSGGAGASSDFGSCSPSSESYSSSSSDSGSSSSYDSGSSSGSDSGGSSGGSSD